MLNLTNEEAHALARELERAGAPMLRAVKDKLDRVMEPRVHVPIPGQTTIDDHLEEAA